MNFLKKTGLFAASMALMMACTNGDKQMNTPTPPKAEKKPFIIETHGDIRTDDYYWLNERENQEVIDYLNAENDYTKKMLEHTEPMQETIFNEIVERIKKDDNTVPYFKDGYWIYIRFEAEKEYPIICRKIASLENDEEIILDVNELAEGKEYCQLASAQLSPNGKLLAFSIDYVSRRQYQIFIKNLETGEISSENISNTAESICWAADNATLFYTKRDESLRTFQVWSTKWDGAFGQNTLRFQEDDDTYNVSIGASKSKDFLIIKSSSTMSDECRLIPLNNPASEAMVFQKRERGIEYDLDHLNGVFYIKTNWEAENFRLMTCGEKNTTKSAWKEIIAHQEDRLFEDVELFNQYLVVDERFEGISQLKICSLDGKFIKSIPFEEPIYSASIGTNHNPESPFVRLSYTSLTTPSSVIDFYFESNEMKIQKEQEVIGDFQKENYVSERQWAIANDGTLIPISIVYRADMFKKQSNPCLIYGYGSYGYSLDVYFSISRLSLLDRGFVFAIAHIRGGEELGRKWYEQGKLLQKKNTFTDFIDCSKYLIKNGYSHPNMLFAQGGSAGGLLMGAVINMAPELYKGVIAAVPFVDVVTTMLDESIPLTTGEFDEWGNPKDETFYHYIKSYSPYDNIEAKEYPNLLVTTGLHDSQVQYWEPAKWVAKLRDLKTDNNLLLLHTNMSAGHGGASGRFKVHKETALDYAFLINLVESQKQL